MAIETQDLIKNLNAAIDTAIKELVTIDSLAKSDVSLQDAKLRPESANGSLPGHEGGAVSDSVLKPEDAHKAEEAAAILSEAANKGENPFADKKEDKKEDKKKDGKEDEDDEEEDEDMDDEKAEKMKAKVKKYEDEKAEKASMNKSEIEQVAETLKKSIVSHVEEVMQKSFGDRLAQLEGLIQKLVQAPQPRQSVSGLAPLAKSSEDLQPAGQGPMSKAETLSQLETLQKSGDKRVDSMVITRVEMGDYSVLAERGINLK